MGAGSSPPDNDALSAAERRSTDRYEVTWAVDCETEDTFLYAAITNISEMGIFVRTREPLRVGTRVQLSFSPEGADEPMTMAGVVQWINPVRALSVSLNPGMGIRFVDLTPEARERLVELVRTIAYVRTN